MQILGGLNNRYAATPRMPDPDVTVRVLIDCEVCHAKSEMVFTAPRSLAEIVGGRTLKMCDSCGQKIREDEKRVSVAAGWRKLATDAGVPENMLDWDKVRGNVDLMRFLWQHRQASLTVCGDYGCGKTWAMCGAVCAMIKDQPDFTVRFWNFNDLLSHYSALLTSSLAEAEKFRRNLGNYDLLVIDDIGKKRLNCTASELIYSIVNRVYESQGKTRLWASYNLPIAKLGPKFDDADHASAIFSRWQRMEKDGLLFRWNAERGA